MDVAPALLEATPAAAEDDTGEELQVAIGVAEADAPAAVQSMRPPPSSSSSSSSSFARPEVKKVRWTPRVPVGLQAMIRVVASAGSLGPEAPQWLEASVTDLSIGGALVRAEVIFPAGHRLEVRIAAPDGGEPIDVMAHVARSLDHGMGVRLMHLSAAVAHRLAGILNEAVAKPALSAASTAPAAAAAPAPAPARVEAPGGAPPAPAPSAHDPFAATPSMTGVYQAFTQTIDDEASDPLADFTLRERSIYDLLNLDPMCAGSQLARGCQSLLERVERDLVNADGRRASRLGVLQTSLQRLSPLWSDPVKRLRYDLRWGHVRADERIAAARRGDGVSLKVLAEVWSSLYPDRVRQAAAVLDNAPPSGPAHVVARQEADALDPFCRLWREEGARDQASSEDESIFGSGPSAMGT